MRTMSTTLASRLKTDDVTNSAPNLPAGPKFQIVGVCLASHIFHFFLPQHVVILKNYLDFNLRLKIITVSLCLQYLCMLILPSIYLQDLNRCHNLTQLVII
jgi:hypothetical protein